MMFFKSRQQKDLEKCANDGLYLRYVKNQTEEICLAAINEYSEAIKHVNNQTEEMCLKAVKINGNSLRHVREQTERVCLAAIKENPMAIRHVDNITPEMYIYATRMNKNVMENILKDRSDLHLIAIKDNPDNLQYIPHQTRELCEAAVKSNGSTLKYVDHRFLNKNMRILKNQYRPIYANNLNGEWLFSIYKYVDLDKETLVERLTNSDGGLKENPHRYKYIDLLKEFE